jgi:hypothetical protein
MTDDLKKVLNNSVSTISPYKKVGMWMYDDDKLNIKEELFIAGADIFLDIVSKGENSCKIIFSDLPFPDYDYSLIRESKIGGGYNYNVFYKEDTEKLITAWLCDVTTRYFNGKHPEALFVKAVN